MPTTRLFEFARQINMDPQELLGRLQRGGLNLKNHMEIMDEKTIQKAREILAKGSSSVKVEETRVTNGVIRRRKVRLEEEGKAKAAALDQEVSPEIKVEKEKVERPVKVEQAKVLEAKVQPRAQEKVKVEGIEEVPQKEAIQRPEDLAKTAVQQERVPTEPPEKVEPRPKEVQEKVFPKKRPPKKKKKQKRKFDEPAKIIKRPDVPQAPVEEAIKVEEAKVSPQPEILTSPPPPKEEELVEARAEEQQALGPVEEKRPEGLDAQLLEEFTLSGDIIPVEREDLFIMPISYEERQRLGKRKKEKKKEELEEREIAKPFKKSKKMEIYEREDLYEGRAIPKKKEKRLQRREEAPAVQPEPQVQVKVGRKKIKMGDTIVLGDLAKQMGVKASEIIKKLLDMGVIATINQALDYETAALLADEYNCDIEQVGFKEEAFLVQEPDPPEALVPRPPVVTVMGHVDHGKTTLLDYIRKTKVAEAESGGITQHIGAYYVKTDGTGVVFLDTPGHEAFTTMRARGAKVTDIIVLVVAADDGVMPQTREAINHAKAAQIPIVVAINKIDKPDSNPERVKRQLAELGLIPEEWGGDVIFGNISAKTGQGVDELLGLILLQAEIMELKANPNRRATGVVIEARLDKTKGPIATVLVKNGTLKPGDYFVCGEVYGRVRAMFDHKGAIMKSAGPSIPVEIYGLPEVPNAGDELVVVPDEKTAKTIAEHRRIKAKERELARPRLVHMEDLFQRIKEGEVKELNVILKADVQGSLEAISEALSKITKGEIRIRIIHSATGAINESDVMLASASNAIIVGFNVRANPRVKELAEKEKVQIKYYDVIYHLINDMELALSGMLEPTYEEKVSGEVEVLQTFKVPKVGIVAGCIVRKGVVNRNSKVRVIRDGVVIHDGKIASLRRFKDDVREVTEGMECGIALDRFQDLKPGDIFEVYILEEVTPG